MSVRPPDQELPDWECSACGSVWFESIGCGEGAVSFDASGRIVAYSGGFQCTECATELDLLMGVRVPKQRERHLRVVE